VNQLRLKRGNEHCAPYTATEMMVFEEIIRHSPHRRASPRIAGGFSPTAGTVWRIIAVLTKIGLVGQGCTRHRKQTFRATSLRVHRTGSRGGAKIGSAALIMPVEPGCTRRRKRAPHATRTFVR